MGKFLFSKCTQSMNQKKKNWIIGGKRKQLQNEVNFGHNCNTFWGGWNEWFLPRKLWVLLEALGLMICEAFWLVEVRYIVILSYIEYCDNNCSNQKTTLVQTVVHWNLYIIGSSVFCNILKQLNQITLSKICKYEFRCP